VNILVVNSALVTGKFVQPGGCFALSWDFATRGVGRSTKGIWYLLEKHLQKN